MEFRWFYALSYSFKTISIRSVSTFTVLFKNLLNLLFWDWDIKIVFEWIPNIILMARLRTLSF